PADTSKKMMIIAIGSANTTHCQGFNRTIALCLFGLDCLVQSLYSLRYVRLRLSSLIWAGYYYPCRRKNGVCSTFTIGFT
ncbi:MAG TPA: hypothetical protein V6D11_23510, partial [Waterburya sp.]